MMALLWESLATRQVKLLQRSMSKRFAIPDDCSWVNYVRCHDDIGWTFADEDAAALYINGFDHRQFLNAFYAGQFEGSFAIGLPFNYNPRTRDMRISGTCASLAGLEQALKLRNEVYKEHALRRMALIHSIILSAGGIPLLYLGDEIATLNDYSFLDDPDLADDSRWVHRPKFDWARAANRHDEATVEGRVFQTLRRLIEIRKGTPAFANGRTLFFDTHNAHVLGFVRNDQVLVLGNFSEFKQSVARAAIRPHWPAEQAVDLVTGQTHAIGETIMLGPYRFLWLMRT
jgi:amylosucrase